MTENQDRRGMTEIINGIDEKRDDWLNWIKRNDRQKQDRITGESQR